MLRIFRLAGEVEIVLVKEGDGFAARSGESRAGSHGRRGPQVQQVKAEYEEIPRAIVSNLCNLR